MSLVSKNMYVLQFLFQAYDVDVNVSSLMPQWGSKASARQRRGRAGRYLRHDPSIRYIMFHKKTLKLIEPFAYLALLHSFMRSSKAWLGFLRNFFVNS